MKPLEFLKTSLKYWWMPVVFMLIGAAGGYVFYLNSPALYESQSIFNISIDYAVTGKLTDIEEDQAVVSAGDVFQSSEVLDRTISAAQKEGIQFSADVLRKNSFVERTNSQWILRVRNENPTLSTRLVNIWSEQGNLVLNEGLRHAYLAAGYYRQLESLATCVEQVAAVEPAASLCGFESSDALQKAMQRVSSSARSELEKSRGLSPALLISWNQRAETEGVAVTTARAPGIFVGAIVGLVMFIFLNGAMMLFRKN